MDIKLTSTVICKDELWGFSDLLNGKPLDGNTKKHIIELLQEDWSELINPENWEIEVINKSTI